MELIFITDLMKTKPNQDCLNNIKRIVMIDDINKIYIITNKKTYNIFNNYIKEIKSKSNISILQNKKDKSNKIIDLLNDIITSNKIKDDIMIINSCDKIVINLNGVKRYFDALKKPVIILHKTNNKKLIKKYGEYYLNDDGFIKSFREHASNSKIGIISAGIYIFPKDSLFWFGKFLKSGSDKLNFGTLIKKISQKRKIRGIVENEYIEK